jgi:spermidine/putrescine transport system permease protein
MTAAAVHPAGAMPWLASALVRSRMGMPVYVWLCLLVFLPNALLIFVSFMKSSSGVILLEPTFANFVRLSQSKAFWFLLFKTLATAAAASLLATLIAFPTAYYASRKLRSGRMLALFLVVIPLWISLLMRVFSWKIILGENGILNSFLMSVGILDTPSTAFLYTPFSVLLTFTYVCIPFVFVTTYSALERIPYNLIEAAEDSGANPWHTFWKVIWPLARPGAAIGFMLAFLLCVGDYITPALVGGLDGTMLGMVIASQFGLAGNWPYGAALALILMIFVSVILVAIVSATRTPGVLMGEDGGGTPPLSSSRMTPAEKLRSWLGFAAFLLPYLFLYMPLLLIVMFSFNDSQLQSFPLSGFTLRWYEEALSNAPMQAALLRSLFVGSIVLIVSAVTGTLFAIILAYGRLYSVKTIELLLAVPVAIPGVVLGITMVLACQLIAVPVGMPRIVAGHASFVMPVIMMVVLSRLRRLDPSLVEAAMDCGADRLRAFFHVLLPLIRGSIIGGALLGFTLSVDEVVVTLFLTGVEPTLPVWVWNQMRFGFTPAVNAIFTMIGVSTLLVVVVAQTLATPDKK